jgi:hypothetical protein
MDRGAFGAYARTVLKIKAHARVCVVENPRTCDKLLRKKFRMDFSRFSCELTIQQVGGGRFVSLQVNKTKRKAN